MKVLVFDTETTGLFEKNQEINSNNYIDLPHCLELAWIVYNTDTGEQYEYDFVFTCPRGIPLEISNINHLDDNICNNGYNMAEVIDIFLDDVKRCDLICGHNLNYDLNMIELELFRLNRESDTDMLFIKPCFDTMHRSKNILKMPTKIKFNYKYPSLSETYKFFFGEMFKNAHSAICDVQATLQIYLKLNR
jgi:DNA polymerase III alpha subunit (gram-positive type)